MEFYKGSLLGGTATPKPELLLGSFDETIGMCILQFSRTERWTTQKQGPVRGPRLQQHVDPIERLRGQPGCHVIPV